MRGQLEEMEAYGTTGDDHLGAGEPFASSTSVYHLDDPMG